MARVFRCLPRPDREVVSIAIGRAELVSEFGSKSLYRVHTITPSLLEEHTMPRVRLRSIWPEQVVAKDLYVLSMRVPEVGSGRDGSASTSISGAGRIEIE